MVAVGKTAINKEIAPVGSRPACVNAFSIIQDLVHELEPRESCFVAMLAYLRKGSQQLLTTSTRSKDVRHSLQRRWMAGSRGCGFQKPTQMPVALYDAKRKYGYAENFGRGMWRISNQGENLIIAKTEDSRS